MAPRQDNSESKHFKLRVIVFLRQKKKATTRFNSLSAFHEVAFPNNSLIFHDLDHLAGDTYDPVDLWKFTDLHFDSAGGSHQELSILVYSISTCPIDAPYIAHNKSPICSFFAVLTNVHELL